MFDELDDLPDPAAAIRRRSGHHDGPNAVAPSRIPELVADAYATAPAPMRARLLECLLQPIGPLGLAAIAAGAFGEFLHRAHFRQCEVTPQAAARISVDQMLELARYVEQCSPETFQRIAALFAASPVAMAGLGGSVLLVALQASRHSGSGRGVGEHIGNARGAP